MKSTQPLTVQTDLYLKDTIVIHPNEGFDLELMNTQYSIKLFANVTIEIFNKALEEFVDVELILKNQCDHGKIILPMKYWKKIGSPVKVKMFYDDNKVLLSNE